MDENYIDVTRRWIDRFVIGLNLCPFARRPLDGGAMRIVVVEARDEPTLLAALVAELDHLLSTPQVETSIVVHPHVLEDFEVYNQFLDVCDQLLEERELVGVIQIASFHPQYQFARTAPGDAENYSNRSPYPMLHLLREDSVEQAIATFPGVHDVPARNIEHLNVLGSATLQDMWDSCFDG